MTLTRPVILLAWDFSNWSQEEVIFCSDGWVREFGLSTLSLLQCQLLNDITLFEVAIPPPAYLSHFTSPESPYITWVTWHLSQLFFSPIALITSYYNLFIYYSHCLCPSLPLENESSRKLGIIVSCVRRAIAGIYKFL